jgi:murein DD-endopeptidase MepM/ murein hydrolase activator NlpD
MWDFHLTNIQKIISGEEALISAEMASAGTLPDSLRTNHRDTLASGSDSLLREEVIRQERMSTSLSDIRIEQIEGLHFFTPVKGIVSNSFDPGNNHPYTDIAAPANSVISSVLDGTVIFSSWTEDTGYTIHIQHNNNLVSIYKHNSKLLKTAGDKVKAGTAIALVGSTGELSSGNHLHFELWHKGEPIDPERYITF